MTRGRGSIRQGDKGSSPATVHAPIDVRACSCAEKQGGEGKHRHGDEVRITAQLRYWSCLVFIANYSIVSDGMSIAKSLVYANFLREKNRLETSKEEQNLKI